MNEFAKKLYSNEAESLFAPMKPRLTEIAQHIVKQVRLMVSEPCYLGHRKLTVTWAPRNRLEASASTRGEDSHVISLSYGVAYFGYKNAALLHELASTELALEKYNELFSGIAYSEDATPVLPAGLTPELAREKFLSAWIAWIFLHEQAHLFQCHGKVLAIQTGQSQAFENTHWVDETHAKNVTGDVAWIRHCFELSADHEASAMAIGYLIAKDNGRLEQSSLWMLVAAMTCLFRYFYGEARAPQADAAQGSHPDPDIRATHALSSMRRTILHPAVRAYASWAETPNDIENVMEHAFITASLYMQLVHFDPGKFPEFLTRLVQETPSRKAYLAGLKKTWASLRPDVVKAYFGPQVENILPEFS